MDWPRRLSWIPRTSEMFMGPFKCAVLSRGSNSVYNRDTALEPPPYSLSPENRTVSTPVQRVQEVDVGDREPPYLYLSRRLYFVHTALRIYWGRHEFLPLVCTDLMLRFGSVHGRATVGWMTNVQHRINNNVDATLLCDCNCVYQLVFSPPASWDCPLLVKFAEVPLKIVKT